MSRPIFNTGKVHQKRTAIWVRQRISDDGGRTFLKEGDQSGVLLADGVGMGKTWEALAATALILAKEGRQRGKGSVLVICPPNLVTKWEEELAADSKFRDYLGRWAKDHHRRVARAIEQTLATVIPVRRAMHVVQHKRYRQMRPAPGTYLVSHGLFPPRDRGLHALCRHDWDVIIVDEAHHARARRALASIHGQCRYRLLLSATPFQLEPREWNRLARALVKGSQPLAHDDVRRYINSVDACFANPSTPGPAPSVVRRAGEVLRRVAARTVFPRSDRKYSVLDPAGEERALPTRLDEFDDAAVSQLLPGLAESTRSSEEIQSFEVSYLGHRFKLASKTDRTFVATRLRRFLAAGQSGSPSPRFEALRLWAARVWQEDIEAALKDGRPRKTIVFTSWVGDRKTGEAAQLRSALGEAFSKALQVVRTRHSKMWGGWLLRGGRWLRGLAGHLEMPHSVGGTRWRRFREQLPVSLNHVANDELSAALAGASRAFQYRLLRELKGKVKRVKAAEDEYRTYADKHSIGARGALRRFNDAITGLQRWGEQHALSQVECYTGSEERVSRDRASAGFRSVALPWVLVASNVGAEGIDLHTYTRRIVHYDLEWNPARMEQREGRGDRVGRALSEPLSIVYCLVPRTYDERMFHQLVARDRWHGVLLGKSAARLADDEGGQQVRLERAGLIRRFRLNLAPR